MLFVFCFSFSFYFVSLSSPLCQSRTFLFFCNDLFFSLSFSLSPSTLFASSSLRLYFSLSLFSPSSLSLSLSYFSSRLQLRFGLRRELRRSPSGPRVFLRRVGEQAEVPNSLLPSPRFLPSSTTGAATASRNPRESAGTLSLSNLSCFVSPIFRFLYLPSPSLLSLLLASSSPSSRSIEVTFITEHMVARTSDTCLGFSREIVRSRVDYLERIEE